MFLSDHQIELRCTGNRPMIDPFVHSQIKEQEALGGNFQEKVISYGVSSYGYDARLDKTFLVPKFDVYSNPIVDPKNTHIKDYEHIHRDIIDIPPGSFVLGQTLEYFRIPRDVLALCLNKSTYARCGVIVNVTPLEPEWEGQVTLEISNTNVKPVRIYACEGIAQFLFAWCAPFDQLLGNLPGDDVFEIAQWINTTFWHKVRNSCKTSYADRKGKYNFQTNVTPPKL